jgi:hypothetical protein
MDYPLPQGTLSIIDAVNWLAQRRDDEWTIWSVLQYVAWREICDAVRAGRLPAYVLDSARQSHEADRAQFAALGDQPIYGLDFRQFASTALESLDTSCFPGKALIPGTPRILPTLFDVRTRKVSGKLFFFLTDLEGVFGEDAPAGAAPDVPRRRLPVARRKLERFLLDFDRKQKIAGESRSEDTAWAAAKKRFCENVVIRSIVRDVRKATGCHGKPGKKPIHAEK